MERFTEHIATGSWKGDDPGNAPTGTLSLPFERREKTRQRTSLQSGEEIGVMLPRGTVMRGGDRLVSETGRVIEVAAAPEPVSTVRSDSAQALARVAYHLGNRHVRVQVAAGWLRYLSDHVLDDMVRGLGLDPETETTPFEPEAGAYGDHVHGRHQLHDHAH